jgi:hypothetical protein
MTGLYKIAPTGDLVAVQKQSLAQEEMLENWIEKNPALIGLTEHLVLGRQVTTAYGGRIDILAADRDGNITVVELKRGLTPREVVAQTLDYASWISDLSAEQIDRICQDKLGKSFAVAYKERFDASPPDIINGNHNMMIVASELDPSSKRIVEYLAKEHGVGINTVFFSIFGDGGSQFLTTDWLMDQQEVEERSEGRKKLPWSGLWYANVGEGPSRSWEDMRKFGFIAAGGGKTYSGKLDQLGAGDTVYMYFKGTGYVGRGTVIRPAMMAKDFRFDGKSIFDQPLQQPNLRHDADDPDLAEYVVPMDWAVTVPISQAKTFPGAFANQNVVCKLRDQKTIDFLKGEFGG